MFETFVEIKRYLFKDTYHANNNYEVMPSDCISIFRT